MKESEKVAIHVIGKEIDRPFQRGNDLFTENLADKFGIETVIVPGSAGAYDKVDQDIILAHPIIDARGSKLGKLQEFALGKSGVAAERTKVILSSGLEEKIPLINGPKLWEMDTKWHQYELAHEYMPRTVKIAASDPFDPEITNTLQGKYLFVKPDSSGGGSQNVNKVARSEVATTIFNIRSKFAAAEIANGKVIKNKDIIIQEDVSGMSLADDLVAIDEDSERKLANSKNTELRIYCYVVNGVELPADERHYATARLFEGIEKDDWAYVDQDSVPQEAWAIADEVADRIIKKTNAPGGFFAVDLIKGDAGDGRGPRMMVREINVAKPVLVSQEYNQRDAVAQNWRLANVVDAMIKNDQAFRQ